MISSIILAGGRSQRFGKNKILEMLGDKTLIEQVVESLVPISDEIIISTVTGQQLPRFKHSVKLVYDVYPGKGSLGGLYSGIRAARNFHSLAVAADMPFLNRSLLSYMIEISADYDAVVPRLRGFVEALHSIYSKNCLAAMEKQMNSGQLNIRGFLPQLKVRYLDEEEFGRFDPEHLSLFNINTMADLEKARQLISQIKIKQ